MKKPNDHAEPTKVERYKNIKILHLSQTDRQTDRQTFMWRCYVFSTYLLMSIYMKRGDLRHMLDEDNKTHNNKQLTFNTRVRILYHVASAIQFLHKPVPEVRYGMTGQ